MPARGGFCAFRAFRGTFSGVTRRTLLRLALPAVLLAVVVSVFALRSRPVEVALASCVGLAPGEARAACITTSLLAADDDDRLLEHHDELLDMVAATPALHDDCHLALHRVGIMVVDSPGEVPALLDGLRSPLCAWGLGHGIFEGFGGLPATPTQWRAVAEVCESFLADGAPVGALCGDGFGHALWDATGSQRPSVDGCASLRGVALQSSCVGGVMMQQLRPADGSRAPRRDLPADEVLALCLDDPAVIEAWFIDGCLAGAGYVLVQALVEDRFAASGSLDDAGQGLVLADAACRALPARGAAGATWPEICFASLVANFSSALRSPDGSFRELCARLDRPERCAPGA